MIYFRLGFSYDLIIIYLRLGSSYEINHPAIGVPTNDVLSGKIEEPLWYTIYHQYLLQKRASFKPLYEINQPMRIWDIYGVDVVNFPRPFA